MGSLPNPEKGEEIYKTYCVNCHGIQGKGDGPAGKMLTPTPANFTSKKTKGKADKELLSIIGNGKPKTAMPPWKNSLSKEQIQDVLAYLSRNKDLNECVGKQFIAPGDLPRPAWA